MMNLKSMVLLSEASASNSATIDFTGLNNSYSNYLVFVNDLIPATENARLYLRVGTGATPTYQSGANDYGFVIHLAYVFNAGSSVGSLIANYNTTFISISGDLSKTTGSVMNSVITIYNPSKSTVYHNFKWDYSDFYNNSSLQITDVGKGSGNYKSSTPVTAVRFLMSSGNIQSGTFKLYGIV